MFIISSIAMQLIFDNAIFTVMYLRLFVFIVCFLPAIYCRCQPLIHSHNDYTHALPFWDAYNHNAGVIEADVYEMSGALMVAHNKADINPNNTLSSMYLNPIIKLFDSSKNNLHTFYLMVDIKENQAVALNILIKLLQQYPSVFNRQVNKNAVQVFISGERPPDSTFHSYPSYIMFDGLPGKNYAAADLNKIVMISDNFKNYSQWNGAGSLPAEDSIRLSEVIKQSHQQHKSIRFWNAPDTEQCWQTLVRLNVDVINTDKIDACRNFLNSIKATNK